MSSKRKSYREAHGSFIRRFKAVGSLVDVYPETTHRKSHYVKRDSRTGSLVSDTQNLRSDWEAVGRAIKNAQAKYSIPLDEVS